MASEPLSNITVSKVTGCGNVLVTLVMKEDGSIFKIRPKLGRNGTCANAMVSAVGKLASLALKNGASLSDVVRKIEGITCQHPTMAIGEDDGSTSCIDAVSKVIADYSKYAKE